MRSARAPQLCWRMTIAGSVNLRWSPKNIKRFSLLAFVRDSPSIRWGVTLPDAASTSAHHSCFLITTLREQERTTEFIVPHARFHHARSTESLQGCSEKEHRGPACASLFLKRRNNLKLLCFPFHMSPIISQMEGTTHLYLKGLQQKIKKGGKKRYSPPVMHHNVVSRDNLRRRNILHINNKCQLEANRRCCKSSSDKPKDEVGGHKSLSKPPSPPLPSRWTTFQLNLQKLGHQSYCGAANTSIYMSVFLLTLTVNLTNSGSVVRYSVEQLFFRLWETFGTQETRPFTKKENHNYSCLSSFARLY